MISIPWGKLFDGINIIGKPVVGCPKKSRFTGFQGFTDGQSK